MTSKKSPKSFIVNLLRAFLPVNKRKSANKSAFLTSSPKRTVIPYVEGTVHLLYSPLCGCDYLRYHDLY